MTYTHQVKMQSGVIGDITTSLKAKELVGKFAMCLYTSDGELVKEYGTVSHVYEQLELNV
ncbi:MAG: hypothetical protein ACRCUH_11725 [Shewanella sp.]